MYPLFLQPLSNHVAQISLEFKQQLWLIKDFLFSNIYFYLFSIFSVWLYSYRLLRVPYTFSDEAATKVSQNEFCLFFEK